MDLDKKAKEILEEVENRHEHRMADHLMSNEETMVLDAIKLALTIPVVSKCKSVKDPNIEKTYLFIDRKDGLTDVYSEDGCLGTGLDTDGINNLKL